MAEYEVEIFEEGVGPSNIGTLSMQQTSRQAFAHCYKKRGYNTVLFQLFPELNSHFLT